jgi:hypothetical protein
VKGSYAALAFHRVRLLIVSLIVAACAFAPSAARAVIHGQPDGDRHPYVGLVQERIGNGRFVSCSGTQISPTALVTAAHCFSGVGSLDGTNSVTGAPIVEVTFDEAGVFAPASSFFFGSYYADPQFCSACGGGLPGFDTHDVAVVSFSSLGCSLCAPIPAAATEDRYGALPSEGQINELPMKTPVDVVGYGVQAFTVGGGPCAGPCTPTASAFGTRFYTTSPLIQSNNSISDEFIKLQTTQGGQSVGDSGGPDLESGGNVILAVTAFGGTRCKGIGYAYRLDTPAALAFINSTIAAHAS